MSDKPSIPEWQRASADSPPATSPEPQQPEAEQSTQAPVPTEEDILSARSNDQHSESTEQPAQAPVPTEEEISSAERDQHQSEERTEQSGQAPVPTEEDIPSVESDEQTVQAPLPTEEDISSAERAEQPPDESTEQSAHAPVPTEEDVLSLESDEQPAQAPQPTEQDALRAESLEQQSESTELLDQASRFLEDPAIHDAPREKKVAFLESKGVKQEDIEALLGATTQDDGMPEFEEDREQAWSTAPPKPADVPEIRPQPREIPPIVTYPEFLASTEQSPPLITTKRLLTTAYVTGGIMASIYGLSKYIIAPMTNTLAESRRDFATHTQEQLKEFNERLGKVVSVDPASKTKITDIADDVSEADSDPTELFHRDYGTQTTPSLSRRPSGSSPTDTEPTVTAHENRLKIIKSHLEELETNRSDDSKSRNALRTKVSDLSTYLGEMSYQNQYYSNMGFYGSNYSLPGKDGKNDQIEVLKGDIRAVKGVFLSARNFPAGGRSTPPMPTGRVGA